MIEYVGDFMMDDGVLKRYIGVGGDVVLPDCVREIGESAFIACADICSAVLPEGLEIIRHDAFSWRTGLLSVTLPKSLRIIEEAAFEGCSNLQKVEIPAGVEQIQIAAFYGCHQLKTIEIPKGIREYDDILEPGSLTAIVAPEIPLAEITEPYKINAAHGFAYLVGENRAMSESYRAEYMDYIRQEIKALCRRALNSMPLLQFLMNEELIEAETLKEMLQQAIDSKNFELTAGLLDYQGKIMNSDKLREQISREEKQVSDELWDF